MFLSILKEFRCFGPVFYSPVFKIPFLHILIALIIHIIQRSVLQDKICREVIDIYICGIKRAAHCSHLLQAGRRKPVLQDHFVNRIPVYIFFNDPFIVFVDIQHLGKQNADPLQAVVIPDLCLDLVAKLVIGAGLMVDLFEHHSSAVPLSEIGIASFSSAEKFQDAVVFSIYRQHLRLSLVRRTSPVTVHCIVI